METMPHVLFEMSCKTLNEVVSLYCLVKKVKPFRVLETSFTYITNQKSMDEYLYVAVFWNSGLVTFEYKPIGNVMGAVRFKKGTFKGKLLTLMTRKRSREELAHLETYWASR